MDTKKTLARVRRERALLEELERELVEVQQKRRTVYFLRKDVLAAAAEIVKGNLTTEGIAEHAKRKGLQPYPDYDTLKTRMQLQDAETPKKPRRGRPMLSEHALPARLKVLKKTVVDVAKELKVSRTTVRSWYAEGDAARAIPERFVKFFERKPYEIPRSAWVNGITD